jgi:16S rRNA (adenine1518-N6/adenine1519-N6)-dimethyltransferase
VHVVEADATTLEWASLLEAHERWTLVANLPYNVATPLVCELLDRVPAIDSMLVMVQREVADRFAAAPGSKQYGAVSVKVAFWSDARVVASVPASVFVPRPNVESALVRLDRRPPPPGVDPDVLFPLVRQAFGQRRKMLRKSLRDVMDIERFEAAGVSPEARPEQLGLDAWCRMAGVIS